MGATTLEEVLEIVPGIHVSRTEGYIPKYQIRGISTKFNSQVLVLINGIPITSLIRGDRNARLGVLPLKMISRVEVIRGPGSALYGADAVAGVINVITKTADDIEGTEVGGRLGSFDSVGAWYLHGGKYGELSSSLMITYEQTAGHKERSSEDAQTGLDRAFGTSASLAPGPVNVSEKRLGLFLDVEKNRWRLRGSFHDLSDVGSGHGIGGALDPQGRFSFYRAIADVTYHNEEFGENWDLTSMASYHQGSQQNEGPFRIFPPGANLGSGVFQEGMRGSPEFWERQIRFENSAFYTGFKDHRARFGLGYFFGEIYKVQESRNFDANNAPLPTYTNVSDTNQSFLPERTRHSFFTYIQDEWQLSKSLEIISGIRYDHFSEFGGSVNPRLALIWNTTPDLTTKVLYGRAFRAPSLGELYSKNNPVNLGNSELRPETIDVYELGWNLKVTKNILTGLNFFHYRTDDLIALVKDESGISATAQNHGSQKGDGFEFESKLKLTESFSLNGNYAYVRAIDERTGDPAGEYPSHQAYLAGTWLLKNNWTWHNQVTWIGERKRVPGDNRSSLEGHTTLDTTLRKRGIYKKYDVAISIRNLFDTDIREPSPGPGPLSTIASIPNDLPQAGISVNAFLTYRF